MSHCSSMKQQFLSYTSVDTAEKVYRFIMIGSLRQLWQHSYPLHKYVPEHLLNQREITMLVFTCRNVFEKGV
mgnify:CR=1 FL=1